jgi:hypothetical protein
MIGSGTRLQACGIARMFQNLTFGANCSIIGWWAQIFYPAFLALMIT